MFRKLTSAGFCAALVVALFAADGRACFFKRRQRCEYPPVPCFQPVCVPCAEATPSAPGSGKATRELTKEIKDLVKTLAKPLAPAPAMPADVAKILGGK